MIGRFDKIISKIQIVHSLNPYYGKEQDLEGDLNHRHLVAVSLLC